jgi:hypothetical protein
MGSGSHTDTIRELYVRMDALISRIFIYMDPDYGGADAARFLCGREGRQW